MGEGAPTSAEKGPEQTELKELRDGVFKGREDLSHEDRSLGEMLRGQITDVRERFVIYPQGNVSGITVEKRHVMRKPHDFPGTPK